MSLFNVFNVAKLITRRLTPLIFTVLLILGTFFGLGGTALAAQPAIGQAVTAIEDLDGMRSGLAMTLEDWQTPPDVDTFKRVCKPVGMKAMQLSKENGWEVKQISSKYRNPAHAPDGLQALMALAKFTQNPELTGFWQSEFHNGQPGIRYFRRINVEKSCLACHGGIGDRPEFVKQNYPQDLAYDFEVGDLRGMYAVFIPEIQAALASPTE